MIFLDTGYFRGLMDEKDPYHNESLKIRDYLKESGEQTVINTTVIVETLNRAVGAGDDIKKLFNDLYNNNMVIHLTHNDYVKSLEINGWFQNSINYSDCTIIKTMIDEGIFKIVSFDQGFEKIKRYHVISSL